MAQVIPVLMVAVVVEGGAFYRIFLPVYSSRMANTSGTPTHWVFYSFLRYISGVLLLAIVGEVGALIALAVDVGSSFLATLGSLAGLGVAFALISAFREGSTSISSTSPACPAPVR